MAGEVVQPGRSPGPRLDNATQLGDGDYGYWELKLYRTAYEASGSFRSAKRSRGGGVRRGEAVDPERSKAEAARRAAGRLRRYGVGNRLNRLVTVTYAGEGCWDEQQIRSDLADFARNLRSSIGKPFPYTWVPEWHPGGHGLHAHLALGRYVKQAVIKEAWGRGLIDIRRLSYLPMGSGEAGEALQAAKYLAKYVRKGMDDERLSGSHRYDVAQGFQPFAELLTGRNEQDLLDQAAERMRAMPKHVWRSANVQDWFGPGALWVTWLG